MGARRKTLLEMNKTRRGGGRRVKRDSWIGNFLSCLGSLLKEAVTRKFNLLRDTASGKVCPPTVVQRHVEAASVKCYHPSSCSSYRVFPTVLLSFSPTQLLLDIIVLLFPFLHVFLIHSRPAQHPTHERPHSSTFPCSRFLLPFPFLRDHPSLQVTPILYCRYHFLDWIIRDNGATFINTHSIFL